MENTVHSDSKLEELDIVTSDETAQEFSEPTFFQDNAIHGDMNEFEVSVQMGYLEEIFYV